MTAKYIAGTYNVSYDLNPMNTSLTIQGMGEVYGTAGTMSAGGYGVNVGFSASVENDGKVVGGAGDVGNNGTAGGYSNYGGNGSAGYAGGVGLNLSGGSLNNTGVITGGKGGDGGLGGYGILTGGNGGNGGQGGAGVNLGAGSVLTNTGTIAGGAGGAAGAGGASPGAPGAAGTYAGRQGDGVVAFTGANITNGSATNSTALIIGGNGVIVPVYNPTANATVTNWGTIDGTGGYAVVFRSASDRLIVEAGSTLIGNAYGGYGTLELASGTTGTITGMGATAYPGGSITGPEAMTFKTFASFTLDAGSTWTSTGYNALTGGTLTVGGALTNEGSISNTAGDGVVLLSGASLTNGSATDTTAQISGPHAVYASSSAGGVAVTNYGTLAATGSYGSTVLLYGGGQVTNGSASDTTALIQSAPDSYNGDGSYGVVVRGAAGTVTNFGTVTGGSGVGLYAGGSVVNGSASDTTALIQATSTTTPGGYPWIDGVLIWGGTGSVTNYGTILGQTNAVWVSGGGTVTNGSAADTGALIQGYNGVKMGYGTLANFGSISGTDGNGVSVSGGVGVTNGSATDTTAQISGSHAVYASSSAAGVSVSNYGTLAASGSYGSAVLLKDGGTVINGSEGDTGALIQAAPNAYNGFYGSYGVKVTGGSGTVTNFGTVTGGSGVALYDGGSLTNGSATDTTALIQATSTPSGNYIAAVYVGGAAGTVSNFGTIDGPKGVFVRSSATVINGSSTDSTALIEGAQGVQISSGTVVNYGSITGGVSFGSSASDRLIAESGSSIVGGASGGGGSLELASGTGTITGFGGSGVVSGDINLGFSGFNNYALDAGSSWTLTGAETIGAGQRLANIGSLEIDVSLTVDGTLYNSGAISGAGELDLAGGSSNNFKGTSVTIANLNMTGMGTTLGLQADLAYGGVFNQGAGTVLNLNSHTLTLSGTGTVLSGQVNGLGGTLLLKGGTDSVSGALSMGHLTLSSGAMMTLSQSLSYGGVFSSSFSAVNLGGKTLTLTKTPTSPLPTATFLATEFDGGALVTNGLTALEGVALGGVHWTDNGTAAQYASTTLGDGATAAVSRLTVGLHGVLAFENDTGIATANGGGAVYNYGTIVKAGGTGVSMVTAVVNNLSTVVGANTVQGKIIGTSGTLEFTQNVNGGGLAVVAGGTLAFDKSFNEFIYFAPLAPLGGKAYGEVKMAKSHAYQGDVLNFATTGLTALDLEDVAYTNTVTPTFKYTGNTSGGVLSVHSGTKTTNINFIGDYTTAIWHLTSDLNGGTVVTATAPTMRAATHAASPAATHPFVQAMASVGASHAATSASGGHDHLASAHLLALVTPRGCAAA